MASASCAAASAESITTSQVDLDHRTRALLEVPLARTLLKLAAPNALVMVTQISIPLVEIYFIAKLGVDSLAGVSQVFPVLALVGAISQGAIGGGVVSAIARALGSGQRAEANDLVWYAAAIAVSLGLITTALILGLGGTFYASMGAHGPSLHAALSYSNLIFGGAVLIWLFNLLLATVRGTGNLILPVCVVCGGALLLVPLSPLLIFGLGGTTTLPRWLLGRAFEILTFERFTFWATLMAMPIVGILAKDLLDRFEVKAAVGLSLAAIATFGTALAWLAVNPYRAATALNVDPVVTFLNRDGHDSYRYITLGFGSALSKVSTDTTASSVDGDYNSARLLPEMTHYGSAQLTNAKFYGSAGMASLRIMLEHANRYGIKYVFVHDSYYEPLLTFVGWRKIETFNNGDITAWSKEDVPPAHKIESGAMPEPWQGLLWGTLPIGVSFLAILLELLLPAKRSAYLELGLSLRAEPAERHYVA